MQRRFDNVTGIGRRIGLNDDKGVVVAVFVALLIVAAVVAGYYIVLRPQPEPYNTISVLDSHQKASDYPTTLVANQNSTFTVYVSVTDHTNDPQDYRVETKVTTNLPASFPDGLQVSPVNTYDFSLANGATNQTPVTVTMNQTGSYSVVFELWQKNGSAYFFTGNYCLLPIQVIT
jgi:uncharacterized membrane protein